MIDPNTDSTSPAFLPRNSRHSPNKYRALVGERILQASLQRAGLAGGGKFKFGDGCDAPKARLKKQNNFHNIFSFVLAPPKLSFKLAQLSLHKFWPKHHQNSPKHWDTNERPPTHAGTPVQHHQHHSNTTTTRPAHRNTTRTPSGQQTATKNTTQNHLGPPNHHHKHNRDNTGTPHTPNSIRTPQKAQPGHHRPKTQLGHHRTPSEQGHQDTAKGTDPSKKEGKFITP